ncbi:MAG: glycerol-3-phosphate responsive antiterminator, partial [Spirochaetales bacterium]|nr:glycerol-3-phosphate responsive antiterminator [Candidatus Physcosoma equi]
MNIQELFQENPIIAAVNSDRLTMLAAESDAKVVFILYGTILTLPSIVDQLKAKGKVVIVHADLITGLAGKDVAIDFIKENTKADGIISTKDQLVKRAKELGLIAGERSFIVDSMALENTIQHLKTTKPDFLEIMPGLLFRVIKEVSTMGIPIIAGGLIKTKEEIHSA